MLGHVDARLTMGLYTKHLDPNVQRGANRVANRLLQPPEDPNPPAPPAEQRQAVGHVKSRPARRLYIVKKEQDV